jgi:hypothetical protein
MYIQDDLYWNFVNSGPFVGIAVSFVIPIFLKYIDPSFQIRGAFNIRSKDAFNGLLKTIGFILGWAAIVLVFWQIYTLNTPIWTFMGTAAFSTIAVSFLVPLFLKYIDNSLKIRATFMKWAESKREISDY